MKKKQGLLSYQPYFLSHTLILVDLPEGFNFA